ncbi:MAG: DUF4391 domain-containing protein [Clostridiales bacterium]|nr:DUF4391 domain-containing protein [Clostridiales bacterium]
MLGLPRNTEFNRIIPKEKLLAMAVTADSVRDVYESQVSRIIWRNKLSRSTYLPYSAVSIGSELELIEIQTKMPVLDKRILKCIDNSIPYYIFHVVTNNNMYQAWAAGKSCLNRTVRIESYHHTGWLQEQDFRFVFTGNTPTATLHNLIKQVDSFCIKPMNEQFEKCSEFMKYFRSMRMSRSYKPVLVLAAIQCGGTISLEKAAQQFIRFYQGRADRGQPTEK